MSYDGQTMSGFLGGSHDQATGIFRITTMVTLQIIVTAGLVGIFS